MADGTITIDLDFPGNKTKFHSDVDETKRILKETGKNAGASMSESFAKNSEKVTSTATKTKEKVNSELDGIHKKIDTKLVASAEKSGITNFKEAIDKIPKKQLTELRAKTERGEAIQWNEELKKMPREVKTQLKVDNNQAKEKLRETDKQITSTKDKLSRFKDIVAGSFVGQALSAGVSKITSGIHNIVTEGMQLDAMSGKLQALYKTMGVGAKGVKELSDEMSYLKKNTGFTGGEIQGIQRQVYSLTNGNLKQTELITKGISAIGVASKVGGQATLGFTASLQRILATGKLTSGSLARLSRQFPQLKNQLVDASGMTSKEFDKALSKGKISSSQFLKWLSVIGETSGKTFKAFSKTQAGAMARMQSDWKSLEAMIAKPLFEAKTKELQQFAKLMEEPAVKQGAQALGKAIERVAYYAIKVIGYIGEHAGDINNIVSSIIKIVTELAKDVWKDFSDIIVNIAKDFGLVNKHSKGSKDALHEIGEALKAISKNKGAIQFIAKALIDIAMLKGFYKVASGIMSIGSSAKKAYAQVGALADKIKTVHGGGTMLTAGKIAGGAGAGLAVGLDDISAIPQDIHSADKRSQDIGGGVGALAGGIATSFIPVVGPLLAPVGALIGKKFGEFGGSAVNNFTKGWQAHKPPKNFFSMENLGWSTKKSFERWGKDIDNYKKQAKKLFNWFAKNWKELGLILINPFVGLFALLFKNNKKFRKWVTGVVNGIKKPFVQFGKWLKREWSKLWDSILNNRYVKAFRKGKFFSTALNDMRSRWNAFKKWLSRGWTNFWRDIQKHLEAWKKSIAKLWNNFLDGLLSNWRSFNRWLGKNWTNFWNGLGSHIRNWQNSIHRGFNNFLNGVIGLWRSASRTVKNIAESMINGVIGIINGGIGAIDSVIHAFGGSSDAIHKLGYVHFANGTKSITKPTLAMVNDGNDSPETGNKEALYRPRTGEFGIFQGKNQLTMLDVGDEIINAKDTANIMRGYGIQHFAGGTDWLSRAGGFLSGAWNNITGTAKTLIRWFKQAKEFIAHPISSAENIFAYNSKNSTKGVFRELGEDAFDTVQDHVKDWWRSLWDGVKDKFDGNDAKNSRLFNLAKDQVGGGFWKFIDKLTDLFADNVKNPSGSGVQRWKPIVKKALAKNGLPTTSDYVNAWLRQIATESGGNPHAVQGNIGDINNVTGDLAKGLVQTISATFEANAFSGHHNIFNGFDNLLAGIHYALNKYGRSGMLSVIGHGHGYQNGGEGNQEGWYKLFEGNHKEFVIPTATSMDRTYEMIGRSAVYAGMKDGVNSQTGQDTNALREIGNKLDKLLDVNSNQLDAMNNPVPAVVSGQDVYNNYNKLKNIKDRYNKFFN